jgi:predicted 3-demethylubiquinone-9 3-methyltransferase (glyoxalase superfamily)
MIVEFQLKGIEFIALNGGPHFKFNEAVSLSVDCADQAEIDDLWEKLSDGGSKVQRGWLQDQYGLSWQIVPSCLHEMMRDPDPSKTKRVMEAVMQMAKLDIDALKAAYERKTDN